MRIVNLFAAGLLVSAALAAHADAPGPEGGLAVVTEPGKALAVATVEMSATVTAIDKATRAITLRTPDGKTSTVTAGPEVQNFDQIATGDEVSVIYRESLLLKLLKGAQKVPVARSEAIDGARAEPGEKPAGGVARMVNVVGDVTAVDAATQVITIKGPQRTVELELQDPEQFKLVQVGDQIQATYTQALAVSVQKAAPAKL